VVDPIPPDHDRARLRALEDELAAASGQLEDYQALIDELPGIYEVKFHAQLRDVAQDIRRLMQERHSLQVQIQHCLDGQAPGPPRAASSTSRPLRWRLALAAGAGVLALAVPFGLVASATRGRRSAPVTPAASSQQARQQPAAAPDPQPRPPQLRLRATGEVWLELRTLSNQVLVRRILQPGQTLSFPLGDGLRVRSGRPHLLEVAQVDQPFVTLGAANDFSWRTFRPLDPGENPALEPEGTGKPS
jgi:hypothetical protein